MLDSLSLAGKFYMEGGGRPSLITLPDLPRDESKTCLQRFGSSTLTLFCTKRALSRNRNETA